MRLLRDIDVINAFKDADCNGALQTPEDIINSVGDVTKSIAFQLCDDMERAGCSNCPAYDVCFKGCAGMSKYIMKLVKEAETE